MLVPGSVLIWLELSFFVIKLNTFHGANSRLEPENEGLENGSLAGEYVIFVWGGVFF